MKQSIPSSDLSSILEELGAANKKFQSIYPGDRPERQPVHTVYGGADLFKADSAEKMGKVAMNVLKTYAPDAATFAKAMGMDISDELASTIYQKVCQKLETEPVEDFRIDFEDGFGNRSDEEEDKVAVTAAAETARGLEQGTLSPFIGIRVKPFTEDLKERGLRTLDIYLSALVEKTGGKLPSNFVIFATTSQLVESISEGLRIIKNKSKQYIPSNITTIQDFENNKEKDFMSYGSSTKNLYLLLLEDL